MSDNEDVKRDRFYRIAPGRVNKVLERLTFLGKCGDIKNYIYDDEEVRKMFNAIRRKLRKTEAAFSHEKEFKIVRKRSITIDVWDMGSGKRSDFEPVYNHPDPIKRSAGEYNCCDNCHMSLKGFNNAKISLRKYRGVNLHTAGGVHNMRVPIYVYLCYECYKKLKA